MSVQDRDKSRKQHISLCTASLLHALGREPVDSPRNYSTLGAIRRRKNLPKKKLQDTQICVLILGKIGAAFIMKTELS